MEEEEPPPSILLLHPPSTPSIPPSSSSLSLSLPLLSFHSLTPTFPRPLSPSHLSPDARGVPAAPGRGGAGRAARRGSVRGRWREGEALVPPWVILSPRMARLSTAPEAGAKASVYAISTANKQLQYVGVSRQVRLPAPCPWLACAPTCTGYQLLLLIWVLSRAQSEVYPSRAGVLRMLDVPCVPGGAPQVYQSMRLHFARYPQLCHWVKVEHVARPSRAALEGIREHVDQRSGAAVPGNGAGPTQSRWENAVDLQAPHDRSVAECILLTAGPS